jgi:UDP-N-acetylglucosamine--N-acetylmuramyl-(pentapeptide) pyrophosphoryl-undecaprenol N-acetylglucosamine transferase
MGESGKGIRVIIAGGGTGGHLYPGIAIARELFKEPGNSVLFVGTKQGIEARVLPKENLPVRFITAGKLKGMAASSILKSLLALPSGLVQSARLLGAEKPDVVIGVGGYASAPVGLAAWMRRIPLVVIEPNSYAGLANRLLGRLASKVVLPFPGTNRQGFFSKTKVVETGPLVRAGIESGSRAKALGNFGLEAGRFTVFVFGGSGGAHAINMTMRDAAPRLKGIPNLQVLHQTGEKDVTEVRIAYQGAGVKAVVLPYVYDMAGAYAAADLVISRSGATTVAELAVCGKKALLVPFPFAADNHQEYNARTLAERGNAEVVIQKDLTPDRIVSALQKAMSPEQGGAQALGTGAAREIAGLCRQYVQKD